MFARFGGYVLGAFIATVVAGVTLAIALALGLQQFTAVVAVVSAVIYFVMIGTSYLIAWLVQNNPASINTLSVGFFFLPIGILVVGFFAVLPPAVAIFVIVFPFAALVLSIALIPKGIMNFAGYVLAQTTSYDTNPAIEQFWRGFNVGTNALYAAVIAVTVYTIPFLIFHPVVGLVVGILLALWFLCWPLFALLNSTDQDVKSVVGRTSFFNPTSWFICGLGAVLFHFTFALHWIGWAFGIPWLAIKSLRIDRWGSIVCIEGAATNLSAAQQGGWDLGTFVWVFSSADNLPTIRHEAGHALSLGLFGGHYHLLGFAEEVVQIVFGPGFLNVGPGATAAYAERVAESNAVPSPRPTVSVWG